MIGVDVFGQMGNQMFQYAFAINASKTLSCDFFIDELTYRFCLPDYFEMPHFNVYVNRLKRKSTKLFTSISKEDNKVRFSNQDEPDLRALQNWRHYWGYFQSEFFFRESRDVVLKEFQVKKKLIDELKSLVSISDEKLLVIHIRLGDYIETGFSLPMSYYIESYLGIPNREDFRVLVVSDEPEQARNLFHEFKTFEFPQLAAIHDFMLIMRADCAIISNSTFSWWAAYLNHRTDKRIIAPEKWQGISQGYKISV